MPHVAPAPTSKSRLPSLPLHSGLFIAAFFCAHLAVLGAAYAAAAIQAQRGDYNGRILSIRQDDLRTLAVIYDESPSLLAEQLIAWGVLNPEARRAME